MLKASHSDSRRAPLTSFWDANRLLVWLLEPFCKKIVIKIGRLQTPTHLAIYPSHPCIECRIKQCSYEQVNETVVRGISAKLISREKRMVITLIYSKVIKPFHNIQEAAGNIKVYQSKNTNFRITNLPEMVILHKEIFSSEELSRRFQVKVTSQDSFKKIF